jgi:hypothetical protein
MRYQISIAASLSGWPRFRGRLPVVHATVFYPTTLMAGLKMDFVRQKCLKFVRSKAWFLKLTTIWRKEKGSTSKQWAIVLFATKGLASFVENALIGIKRCGIDIRIVQLVFPAQAEVELGPIARRYGARSRILESLVDVDVHHMPDSYVDWNTPEFNIFLKYRFPALRAILAEGNRVVCADIDVSWLRNPLPYLSEALDHHPWACQVEASPEFPQHFCLGFFAVTSSPDVLRLIDLHIARYTGEAMDRGDQTLFHELLIESPRFFANMLALPESFFPTGLLYRSVGRWEPDRVPMMGRIEPYIFHANWCVGLENKRRLLSQVGAWFATDEAAIALKSSRRHNRIFDLRMDEPGIHRYRIPARVAALRLISKRAFLHPDHRQLGVAVTNMRVNGVEMPLDDPSLVGFYPVENDGARTWRWTDGAAIIPIPVSTRSGKVEIELMATASAMLEGSLQAASLQAPADRI